MNRIICAALLLLIGCAGKTTSDEVSQPPTTGLPKPEVIALSGTFHQGMKSPPQLKIIPAGVVDRIELGGNYFHDGPTSLQEGDPIYVEGVVRTVLQPNLPGSPREAQWRVWIDVTRIERMSDPYLPLKQVQNRLGSSK